MLRKFFCLLHTEVSSLAQHLIHITCFRSGFLPRLSIEKKRGAQMDYSSIIDEASETKYCYARKKKYFKKYIYIYFGAHKNLIFEKRHVKFCKIL